MRPRNEPAGHRPAMRSAEEAGVLQRAGGRLGFTHPLLGSTVYAEATPHARRSVHRRLAELVDDPEERARHLALAASGPHADVARALEEAGRHARARGAPDAAAELLELARKLTPPEDDAGLPRRSVAAAEYHFDAGDATRATALLEESIAMARPGRDRARILFRLASISWLDMHRVQGLSEQALREVGDDAETRAAIHEHLAWVGIYRGDLAFAAAHASASMDWARVITDPAVRAESLSTFGMVEFLLGRPARDLMAEAVQLEDAAIQEGLGSQTTVFTASRTCHGLQLLWAGELDAARAGPPPGADRVRAAGTVCRQGRAPHLPGRGGMPGGELERRRQARPGGVRHRRRGWVAVGAGPPARSPGRWWRRTPATWIAARSDAEEGLRQSLRNEDMLDASCNRAVLGFLELSLSNAAAAMEQLEPVLAFLDELGSPEPGIIPVAPDAIEALVSLGRLEEAEALLDRLERQGRTLDRPWAIATAGARPRAAHRGPGRSVGGTLGAGAGPGRAPASAAALRAGPDPAGEGRGGAQSQAEASRPLHPGAGAWSSSRPSVRRCGPQRARDDLARVGGPVPPSGELTPTEQRIAQLVGEGKKNREVADALFISVKTVEANLSRIFHKLGVRSRTELTRRIATTHGQQTTSTKAGTITSGSLRFRGFPPIPHRSTRT